MTVADINYDGLMTRWEPNARERLEEAAFSLYGERGFDDTTVAEIAERAGLTERTFFRHFADKREVLFAGASALQDALVDTVAEAPASLAPIEAVAAGLEVAASLLPDRNTARRRQRIVAGSAELRERELIKLASLGSALADALRHRGLDGPAASLTAEIAIAVFKIAVHRWATESSDQDVSEIIRESLHQVNALTAG